MWLLDIISGIFGGSKEEKSFNIDFVNEYEVWDYSYKSFFIPKKDGSKREIFAPNEELKKVQRDILNKFSSSFRLPWYVTWFRKNYSIKTNAQHHTWKEVLVKIDIENFFPSITEKKLKKMFLDFWYEEESINKLLKLITYNGSLAQWAPTSPFFANLVFLQVDKAILKLLKNYDKNVEYTRYADDITFSSNNSEINRAIAIIINSILPNFGYKAHPNKIRVKRKWKRQMVTWLVVNEKISYPRNKYMKLRAMIHNFLQNKAGNVNEIKGHLSFLKSVDKKKYNKLKFYYRRKFKWTENYNKIF